MKISLLGLILCWCCSLIAADSPTTFYFIDTGLGNATLIVSPSGQSILLDTGTRRTANRVVAVAKAAGLQKIDWLLSTHYHEDHFGAAVSISEAMPVGRFVDHGPSVEYGKSDDWWKERRGPWFHEGMGKAYDESFDAYVKTRDKAHTVVKAGDKVPVAGLDVSVLVAAGKCIEKPLPGAGAANPDWKENDRRGRDDAEDAQSIGVLITMGKFRFVYLGDLTWNESLDLFCPQNKVGTVDAYVVTHHAQSLPKSMGDYYWGLSACPPAEVHGLRPRVAFLSLANLGHKVGDALAMETLRSSPGLEDVWQTEKVIAGGEKGHNSPDDFIANNLSGGNNNEARYIKMIAHPDGSMEVSNSRNGFTKKYPVKK